MLILINTLAFALPVLFSAWTAHLAARPKGQR